MSYGDYSGPDKPNKGHEGGACNRSSCQAEPARWYNHGSLAWYCDDCARDIGEDVFNKAHWERDWQPRVGHPQFETREMIAAREAGEGYVTVGDHVIRTRNQAHADALLGGGRRSARVEYDPVATAATTHRRERQAPRPRDQYNMKHGWKPR